MEYQKIINMLDNKPKQRSKSRTRTYLLRVVPTQAITLKKKMNCEENKI